MNLAFLNGWILTGLSGNLLISIAIATILSVIALYLLRVRRRRIEVPFSPLWKKVLQTQKATHLWERLKRSISLLIHLLILGLFLLALADPRKEGDQETGRSVILLIDTSASMMTHDETESRTRIQRALSEAENIIQQLGPKDELMLVRMDGQLRPLTPFSTDHAIAIEKLRAIEATATEANIEEALRYAIDSLASRANSEIVIATDGAFHEEILDELVLPSTISLYGILVGESTDNVGITAFNVRRYPANRTNYEVYIRVENFSEEPASVELEIFGENRLIEVQQLELPAFGSALRIYPELPSAGGHLSAQIKVVAGDLIDKFALDDVAYALMPHRGPVRVLLVTEGNLYLEGPLILNESLETTIIRPQEYVAANNQDPSSDFDITIFDQVTPPISDHGNFMFVRPEGEFSPWNIENTVADPIIHSIRRDHPLMSWIGGMRDVNILSAQRLDLDSQDQVIAGAIGGSGMIVTRETPSQRLLAIAFPFEASDFPLRVGFPVFILNVIDWFTQESAGLLESFNTGETWMVSIDNREITSLDVTLPNQTHRVAQAYNGTAVFYGEQVGFHTLHFENSNYEIAGNLTNRNESQITPATSLRLAGVEADLTFTETPPVSTYDPWIWLLLAAFAILILEWWTWNRRITV